MGGMPKSTLDDLDRRLLACLRADARSSVSTMARSLGVARSTVQARIGRLERRGVIAGYTVRVDPAVDAGMIRAHVMISVQSRYAARVTLALGKRDDVRTLYAISGQYDMIAVVISEDTRRLNTALDEIGCLPGVERTVSSVVLETKFDRQQSVEPEPT